MRSFLLNVDVPMNRLPIVNWVLMGIIACTSLLAWTVGDLLTWSSYGFFLLHINVWHLLCNLLFLWVFGNAVNYKVGHWWYLVLFVSGGAVGELALAGAMPGVPGIGASDAIMSLMGAFLVFFPRNEISGLWAWPLEGASWQMIVFGVGTEFMFYGMFGPADENGAYVSHIAGFAIGFMIGFLLAWTRTIEPTKYEETLLQLVGIHS